MIRRVRPKLLTSMAAVFFGAACACHAAPQHGPLLWFDTDAGDTWSFAIIVTGKVRRNGCDEVEIDSPLGRSRAALQQQQFNARIALRSGPNRLVAVCIKDGRPQGQAAQSWEVRAQDLPHASIRTAAAGNAVTLDARRSTPAQGIPAVLQRFDWRAGVGNPAALALGSGPRITFSAPAVDGVYRVTLRVTDARGRSDESSARFRVFKAHAVTPDGTREHPAWLDDAVVYGLAPAFLAAANFSSIAADLDEMVDVGATVLWLPPVTEAPPEDFGYAVTDPFVLRRSFGGEIQFRALLDAVHVHGMRVMLDAVTNHLARQSPYFLDAQQRGRRSPYYDWFERDAAGRPVHYFDWKDLENLNYDVPEVRAFMLAALAHWIRDYPVDGLRLDAIWALQARAPAALDEFRREFERINPDLALLAEADASAADNAGYGFDAAYDWTTHVGQWAWHDVFGAAGTTADVGRLRRALGAETDRNPRALKVLHFLNNNDTGRRFITRYGPEQSRIAAVLLFTLPGVPLIYAGDEVGAEFEPYDLKQPIDWTDRYGLKPLYRRLSRLRQATPSLRGGQMTLVATNADDRVLAYLRRPLRDEEKGDTPCLVLINFSPRPAHVEVGAAEPLIAQIRSWWALNPFDGTRSVLSLGPSGGIELSGYGAMLLQPDLTRGR